MKSIRCSGTVKDGVLSCKNDEEWSQKYDKFCDLNDGKKYEMTVEIVDPVRYYIHKYYRGFLLPDIASAYTDKTELEVHEFILKKDFLLRRCMELEEIPVRHYKTCKFVFDKERLTGYIPSMSKITNNEAKEYVLKCEKRLEHEMGDHIGVLKNGDELEEYQNTAKQYREEIFNG